MIPYYHKIKSKIQTCRIYFLKKYIKLLKTVVETKNKELSLRALKGDSKNESRSFIQIHKRRQETKRIDWSREVANQKATQ